MVQNEEVHWRRALVSTRVSECACQPQVIVADGGSSDGTIQQAKSCADVMLLQVGSGGRGRQLNAGAHSLRCSRAQLR